MDCVTLCHTPSRSALIGLSKELQLYSPFPMMLSPIITMVLDIDIWRYRGRSPFTLWQADWVV